jgi:hypothetical protein
MEESLRSTWLHVLARSVGKQGGKEDQDSEGGESGILGGFLGKDLLIR